MPLTFLLDLPGLHIELLAQAFYWMVAALYMLHVSISITILRTVFCRDIDGVAYLAADMRVKCDSSRRVEAVLWVSIGVVAIIIGVPVLLLLLQYRSLRHIARLKKNVARVRSLGLVAGRLKAAHRAARARVEGEVKRQQEESTCKRAGEGLNDAGINVVVKKGEHVGGAATASGTPSTTLEGAVTTAKRTRSPRRNNWIRTGAPRQSKTTAVKRKSVKVHGGAGGKLKSITQAYSHKRWWFVAVDMLRKVVYASAGLLVATDQGPLAQIFASLVAVVAFQGVLYVCDPYFRDVHRTLVNVCQGSLGLFLLCTMRMLQETSNAATWAVAAIILCFVRKKT